MNNSRINRVLDALKEQGLTQMLICDPMSIYYLTGVYVQPFERFYAFYINASGEHVLFLNTLFVIPDGVECRKVWMTDTDDPTVFVNENIDHDSPLGVDKDLKARFLLPLIDMKAASGFVNSSLAVDLTRGVKDEDEQRKMRIASQINDAAMEQFKGLIREGVTEKQVADQILKIYQDLGADDCSFPPIVSFGANAGDPHHGPDDTVLKEGDAVLFDVGCIKDGYCSDMTRTFYYRSASDKDREIYELVKTANISAEKQIRAGVEIHVFDDTARKIITDGGYGPNFTHRLGHFIGMDEHEFGDVSAVNTRPAQPGMIFSIEPGIYIAGDTGVRIEDLVLVTEDGVELLNNYSKELEIIG